MDTRSRAAVVAFAVINCGLVSATSASAQDGQRGLAQELANPIADLIILDQNPLAVDPMKLKDIKVLETIMDGKSICKSE